MSTLQEKVNQAFRDANPSTPSTTLTKNQWLQQEWPELRKPQLTHLSQLKRQLVENTEDDIPANPEDDAPTQPLNPEDDAPPPQPLNSEDVRPRRVRRRNAYNQQTENNGRPLGGNSNRNPDDDDEFGEGPGANESD